MVEVAAGRQLPPLTGDASYVGCGGVQPALLAIVERGGMKAK
jgi:hypothetical protein